MWEGDPRYQEANYRFLLFLTATLTGGVVIWSAWEQEWMILSYWVLGLFAVLSTLALYTAAVWLVGYSIIWTARIFKGVFYKNHGP
jgi:hypothetical protein